MATIERFEEIEGWKTARVLTNLVYDLTSKSPFAKDYALKQQIQRACVSVMSNIAEGFESQTQSIFINLLGRAKGSAGEVRSQLYIALDRKYISEAEFKKAVHLSEICSRQIYGFMDYLKSQPNTPRVREDDVEYQIKPSTFNLIHSTEQDI
jgi:four helix bundle protein